MHILAYLLPIYACSLYRVNVGAYSLHIFAYQGNCILSAIYAKIMHFVWKNTDIHVHTAQKVFVASGAHSIHICEYLKSVSAYLHVVHLNAYECILFTYFCLWLEFLCRKIFCADICRFNAHLYMCVHICAHFLLITAYFLSVCIFVPVTTHIHVFQMDSRQFQFCFNPVAVCSSKH